MFVELTDVDGTTHHVAIRGIDRVVAMGAPGEVNVEGAHGCITVEVTIDGPDGTSRPHLTPAVAVARSISEAHASVLRQQAALEQLGRMDAVGLVKSGGASVAGPGPSSLVAVRGAVPAQG